LFDRDFIIDSLNVIRAEITITTITHQFGLQNIYQKYSIYQQEKQIVNVNVLLTTMTNHVKHFSQGTKTLIKLLVFNSNNNNNNNDNINFQQSSNTVVTGNINVANQINVMNMVGRKKRAGHVTSRHVTSRHVTSRHVTSRQSTNTQRIQNYCEKYGFI
jgi:hypothetical protein